MSPMSAIVKKSSPDGRDQDLKKNSRPRSETKNFRDRDSVNLIETKTRLRDQIFQKKKKTFAWARAVDLGGQAFIGGGGGGGQSLRLSTKTAIFKRVSLSFSPKKLSHQSQKILESSRFRRLCLGIDYRADQIVHSVANGSPPQRRFFMVVGDGHLSK